MLRRLCNACKREISLEEVAASVIVAREWGARHPALESVLFTDGEDDYFCPEHLPFAEDYWTDKEVVREKLASQAASTIRNHCKEFFKKSPSSLAIEVVDESKGLPGKTKPIPARSKNEGSSIRQAAVS